MSSFTSTPKTRAVVAAMVTYARGCGCLVCGCMDNIELHHIDPPRQKYKTKRGKRKRPKIDGMNISGAITELQKCVPLCGTHHDMLHEIKGMTLDQLHPQPVRRFNRTELSNVAHDVLDTYGGIRAMKAWMV